MLGLAREVVFGGRSSGRRRSGGRLRMRVLRNSGTYASCACRTPTSDTPMKPQLEKTNT
ncbi:hypothetical protein D3C83_89700 [compost metagenome]